MVRDECNYFSFWAILCPFTPSTAQKFKFKKNMKKQPGDIIILHNCTKNHDHMLYCFWDMVRDRCNCYFSLWVIFCPLNPENKILKKWKKLMEIASFYTSVGIASFNTSVPQIMIICYTLPEIWHMMDVTVIFHFGLFFALLLPTSPKNENFKKKWKKGLEISSFYTCTPKIMISWCTVPEISCVTDR